MPAAVAPFDAKTTLLQFDLQPATCPNETRTSRSPTPPPDRMAPPPAAVVRARLAEVQHAFERIAESGERSVLLFNPCVSAWFDCCNNTGLSHRQSNLACGVNLALRTGRSLVVEELPQAQKHVRRGATTRCPMTHLAWSALYDLAAVQRDLGVRVRPRAGLFPTGKLRRAESLMTPRKALGRVSAPYEVVSTVADVLASRAQLVVLMAKLKFCDPCACFPLPPCQLLPPP